MVKHQPIVDIFWVALEKILYRCNRLGPKLPKSAWFRACSDQASVLVLGVALAELANHRLEDLLVVQSPRKPIKGCSFKTVVD